MPNCLRNQRQALWKHLLEENKTKASWIQLAATLLQPDSNDNSLHLLPVHFSTSLSGFAIVSSLGEMLSSLALGQIVMELTKWKDQRNWLEESKWLVWPWSHVSTDKHLRPNDAHPHPWFQVTGAEKDVLREPTSVCEFQESNSPSCSRQSATAKNCIRTGQTFPMLFTFLDVCVDGHGQQRQLRAKPKH